MVGKAQSRDALVGKPNPGSPEAIELGCKCPVLDNRRGRGAYFDAFGQPVFWYSDACYIHSCGQNQGV